MFQILKNKRFNLFSITLRVQLFYIILYTEDEHFAKTLYHDLRLLLGTVGLILGIRVKYATFLSGRPTYALRQLVSR